MQTLKLSSIDFLQLIDWMERKDWVFRSRHWKRNAWNHVIHDITKDILNVFFFMFHNTEIFMSVLKYLTCLLAVRALFPRHDIHVHILQVPSWLRRPACLMHPHALHNLRASRASCVLAPFPSSCVTCLTCDTCPAWLSLRSLTDINAYSFRVHLISFRFRNIFAFD